MIDVRENFWSQERIVREFTQKKPSQYITDCLDGIIQSGMKALDIGCGGGRYTFYLEKKGLQVTAIDRHKDMASVLNGNNKNISFFVADMKLLPFEDSSFDLVLSIGVFHNAISVEELKKSVEEASRVLKQGGMFVCSIFTNDVISSDLQKSEESHLYMIDNYMPMILLSKENINTIIYSSGFENIKIIDEHVTHVSANGERYVYSFSCSKR